MDLRAPHALNRFGLGRAANEPLPADPARWLAAQLIQPDPGPDGATVAEAFAAEAQDRANRRQQQAMQPAASNSIAAHRAIGRRVASRSRSYQAAPTPSTSM